MASPTRAYSLPAFKLRRSDRVRPFDLKVWFAAVGLVAIAAISIFSGFLLSNLLTDRMLRQEAQLTLEFVQSVVLADKPDRAFAHGNGISEAQRSTFEHIGRMPYVLRANLYSAERRLVWSSDPSLIGKQFGEPNPELERSLVGELVVNEESPEDEADRPKSEHENLETGANNYFVEIYIPIWDAQHREILGAMEFYKNPRVLFEALQTGKRMIWAGAMIGGIFLFLALFSMILRADNLIRSQQARLVESERLAAVGELGSAVAHGIRNPLTAIRSSAELALEGDPDLARESARDIMAEVDRLEQWVRELLSYSRPVAGAPSTLEIVPLLKRCAGEFGREMEKQGIACRLDLQPGLPPIRGDAVLLAQVLNSLIANAMEAMQGGREDAGARIAISASPLEAGRRVEVTIADNGAGMSKNQLELAFKPFFTTKTKGLGVGLPLAKRIIERFGGTITLASAPGKGTTVRLQFPAIQ